MCDFSTPLPFGNISPVLGLPGDAGERVAVSAEIYDVVPTGGFSSGGMTDFLKNFFDCLP